MLLPLFSNSGKLFLRLLFRNWQNERELYDDLRFAHVKWISELAKKAWKVGRDFAKVVQHPLTANLCQ